MANLPAPSVALRTNNLTNKNIYINVIAPTGVSTADVQRQVSFDNGNTWTNWRSSTYASENITVLARYYVIDGHRVTLDGVTFEAGAISDISAPFEINLIDKIVPTIEVEANDSIKIIDDKTSGDVKVFISDAGVSGLADCSYIKDSGEAVDILNGEVILNEVGNYTITANDNAGNTKTKQIEIVPKPKIITTPTVEDSGVYNFNVEINVEDKDSASLRINGENVEPPYMTNAPFNEILQYKVSATDIYGSQDNLFFIVFKKEKEEKPTEPAINIFYKEKYLDGRQAKITKGLSFYLKKAENILKQILNMSDLSLIGEDENVSMCICELADYLYIKGKNDNKVSESVDGYSVTFNVTIKTNGIVDIIKTWIPKEWLYAGVYR